MGWSGINTDGEGIGRVGNVGDQMHLCTRPAPTMGA